MMARYFVLIDGEAGGYGASFPDLPGCVAMGDTVEEAMNAAIVALGEWVETTLAQGGKIPAASAVADLRKSHGEDLAQGAVLASVPLVLGTSRPVKANLSLDAGVLAAIDAAANRLGVTRSAMIEIMARKAIPGLA